MMSNIGEPLLLLGSARSGTTLLQRILNSYDDVILWGEHNGVLAHVADSYFKLADSESMSSFSFPYSKGNAVPLSEYKQPEKWQAWNNWFQKEDIVAIYRGFLSNMFLSRWQGEVRYWGFKEIRYGAPDKVVDMFLAVYPGTKVIVMYRNPLNVIDSQLAAFHHMGGRLEKLRKTIALPKVVRLALRWRKLNRKFIEYQRTLPGSVHVVQYEKLVSDEGALATVLSELGLSFGNQQRHVLNLKAGRGSAYSENKKKMVNDRWTRLGILPALIVFLITNRTYMILNKL